MQPAVGLGRGSSNPVTRVPKQLWGYDRVTFLVDRNGKVAHVWPAVDPAVHAREVIAEASKLPLNHP